MKPMKLSKLQSAICEMLKRRVTPMTTLEMLSAPELKDFWWLQARLYRALAELVDVGLVGKLPMGTIPQRNYLPRFLYAIAETSDLEAP